MTVRLFTHQGHTDTLAGWAARIGISREALNQRLNFGWSEAEALSTPRYGRLDRKARSKRVKRHTRTDAPKATPSTMLPSLAHYLEQQHQLARQLNDTLRMFIKDAQQQLDALNDTLAVDLLGNPDPSMFIDRGKGHNFAETLPDRLVPTAQDSQNIEFSQCP